MLAHQCSRLHTSLYCMPLGRTTRHTCILMNAIANEDPALTVVITYTPHGFVHSCSLLQRCKYTCTTMLGHQRSRLRTRLKALLHVYTAIDNTLRTPLHKYSPNIDTAYVSLVGCCFVNTRVIICFSSLQGAGCNACKVPYQVAVQVSARTTASVP